MPRTDENKTLAERTAEEQAFWDFFAQKGWTVHERTSMGLAQQLYQIAGLGSAKKVLEMGCGAGRALKVLFATGLLNPSATIDAKDISTEMLKIASQQLEQELKAGTLSSLEQGDAQDLSAIPAASYDRYMANLTLQLVPEPSLMLKEARRVLTDDGFAAFAVWGDEGDSPMFTLSVQAAARVQAARGAEVTAAPPGGFGFLKDEAVARKMIADAGFSRSTIYHVKMPVDVHAPEQALELLGRMGPMANMIKEQFGQEGYDEYLGHYSELATEVFNSPDRMVWLDAAIVLAYA